MLNLGNIPMDALDLRILSILQNNGQISMARLSEQVGLSLSACHRRVKILETNGTISNYATCLDRKAIGLEMQVFIEVKLSSHYKQDQVAFEATILAMPDVLECHLISGEFDYLMRVAVSNPSDYEDFYRNRLSQIPSVAQVKTLLSLSTLKEFQGYNLEQLGG
jgi:DNA-binding Lrp family transcriptional regulator